MDEVQGDFDIELEDHGTVVLVRPVTQEAKDWVEENADIKSWQWMGDAFHCDHRMLGGLLIGMMEDGLKVPILYSE